MLNEFSKEGANIKMDCESKKKPKENEDEKEENGAEKSCGDDLICPQTADNNSSSSSSNKEVKSTAVVKFSAVQSPVLFFKLRSNTDLNRPPDNWLRESDRCQVLKGHSAPPSAKTNSQMFPSLQMASEFPDCVGEVDVVSNSEIIKKLLKMPYSNSQVSMMVHRVGKTLFLDDFDINMYLLQAAKKEWEWLRKFYVENVLQSLDLQEKVQQKNFFRKNRSRDYLQHKNMLSKFLYHSVADAATSPIGRNETHDDQTTADDDSRSYVHRNKLSASNECNPLVDDFEEDCELNEDVDHNFQRNVLWTFEDIRMLIGTDMPIFGAGTHPCVSLRLRDITKPINILTGLDYWLDNLMCNVPEVMMCYHLEGIVQKYELIKTEDLPQLENSNFSPKVIKDIAQNVLSFLKSKATKAGHTYWLFKAKDNEVVKLYDLTTLCSSSVDEVEEEQNPFTMPLAMLLYRLASKMKASGPKKSQMATILMLLQNCLALLDSKKHPQIAMSTHYHLSDLYIPDTLDLSSPNLSPGTTDDEDDDYDDEVNEEESVEAVEENFSSSPSSSSSVEIKTLCLPNMLDNRACVSDNNACRYPLLPASLEERCQAAIHHAQDGLACLEMASDDDDDNAREARTSSSSLATSPSSKTSHYQASNSKEEVQARAQPFKPIPLHYEPINKSKTDSVRSVSEKMCLTSKRKFGEWTTRKAFRLLQKGALAAYVFAYRLYGSNKAGVALRYTELALRCYDAMECLSSSYSVARAQSNILASYILLLTGDLHFLLIQNASHLTEYQQEYNNFSEFEGLFDSTRELNGEFRFEWAVSFHTKLEDNLRCSVRCYEGALEKACNELDRVKLRKRLGNIKNELGVFYLNQAHNMYIETGELSTEVENLWKISYECLQSGIQFFEGMDDDVNAALLNSNLGRLMRTRAHCYTPPKDSPKEFSTQEGNFYEKAITYYRKSLRILGDSQEYANIKESVLWELSTTYFTMATLLQDFAPLSSKPQEEVEKEITELMQKALKCIDLEKPTVRQPIYQYRAATIHHRLGSLYHHSYRHSFSDEGRKKQQRTLADMYLAKALGLFQILEDVGKSLEVNLERIGMWEFHIKSVTSTSAKVQSLYKLLEFVFEMVPILTILAEKLNHASDSKVCAIDLNSSNSNADDISTYVDLLSLVQQRLQFTLLSLVKLYAGKTTPSKKGQQQQTNNSVVLQTYKRMYNEALQLSVPTKDDINVENLIKTISEIRQLYSSVSVK